MKPSLQKLLKFLKLEAERGYDNRAVVGGLERMLTPWEAEARLDNLPEELIQVVVTRLRDYAHLTPNSREEALKGLWKRLQQESGTPLPALISPSTRKGEKAEIFTPKTKEELSAKTGQKEGISPQAPEEKPASIPSEPPSQVAPETLLSPGEDFAGQKSQASQKGSLESLGGAAQEAPEEKMSEQVSGPLEPISTEQITEIIEQPAEKIPSPPSVRRVPEGPPAALQAPLTVLSGVGPRHAQTLSRLGLHTLEDMLYNFPRRYDDYTQLRPINRLFYGDEITVIGTVQSVQSRVIRTGHFQMVEAVVNDGSGSLRITWFNQPWLTRRLRSGMQVVISGKIDQYLGRLVMNNPEWEPLEQQNLHTNRIVPVYSLTANITQRWLRKLMFQVVSYWAPRVQDYLPEKIRQEANLMELPTALYQAHFPDTPENLQAARHRLAFDEIFLLQLGVLRQKQAWQNRTARVFEIPEDWLAAQISRLPFGLTGAQQRALQDVCTDLSSGRPMNRLLQGDVGSGKTIIAALAAAMIARAGAQAAMMAPTGILAEQHYRSLLKLLSGPSTTAESVSAPLNPDQIRLMVGATPENEKREIREGLAKGEIKVVVGTHALIEGPVTFADLQLAIIDEQHRFGVEQRSLLRSKSDNPHLLVMTATPIPRSLALTVYGDLDLSVMDEMPPGRQPILTHVLYPRERERAYALIRSQIEQGRQAFIIYPLIEESEKSDTLSAIEEHARLQKDIFSKQKLGLLHGRMKSEEKDEVMARFRDRQIDILVSTSVVEVGVDIPNATVMMVEGANRFGLSQLHQFRGRVGRGQDKAFCLLIPETPDDIENQRLTAMVETNDGFVLAERDLEQRGPGEFLGTRQSGYSGLRLASLTDVHLIEKARQLSQALFKHDPNLELREHHLLSSALQHFWGGYGETNKGDIS